MTIFEDTEEKAGKRFDLKKWEQQQRIREYAREEKMILAENYIVPLVTQWTAAAECLAPPDHDIYAVPKGTAVTTNRKRRERHPIASDGGFVMLSRQQIRSLLSAPKFARSAATQAVFLWLVSSAGYGGDIDPVEDSAVKLAEAVGISRQQASDARQLLYELDVIRPRDPKPRSKCWVLNPVVAFSGDSKLFNEREFEFLRYTPKVLDKQRKRTKSKGPKRTQRVKVKKKASSTRKNRSSAPK